MSARDLVGRPLVPFFDAHDNVNETLEVDAHANEQLDVDARVWDKELGYFVYPNEANGSAAPATSGHSMPIPIKKAAAPTAAAQDGGSGSFGKMLLTPDMLSRSAPSASGSGMEHLHNTMGMTHAVDHHVPPVANDEDVSARASTPRSASAKRASRQKNRSSTPNRGTRNKQRNGNGNGNGNGNAQQQQQQQQQSPTQQQPQQQPSASDGGSSGGEDRTASDGSEKPKNGKKNRKSRNKQQNAQPQTPQKSKDGDLSSNGKWAWSAFQSSPDPKSLPLPPFVAGPGSSPGMGALPPPMDPPKIEERLDPPPPPLFPGRPPSLPPDGASVMMMGMASPPLPPPHPASLEHSMTQDLRRMLNIGS